MNCATLREDKINKMYIENHINSISDLSICNISETFNINVRYHKHNSRVFYDDYCAVIYLNENEPICQQRADFFHEMAHFIEHVGDQMKLPKEFIRLQEAQAYRFSLFASMPRHIFLPLMLKYKSIESLAQLFILPENMIKERIEMIRTERHLKQAHLSIQAHEDRRRRKSLQPGQVYDSTITILNQLKNQVGEERMSYEVKRLLR